MEYNTNNLNNKEKYKFLNLFYDFENLQDCLVAKISGSQLPAKQVEKNNAIIFLDSQDNLLGFNIKNIKELNLNVQKGINLPSKQLINELSKIIEINLDHFVDVVPFVIGKIKNVEKIPNTHLNYCEVDIGKNQNQKIICGAKNVVVGLNVVVVLPGGIIPTGKEIFESKVLGYTSNGMICSAKELGLKNISEEKTILELPNDLNPGDSFLEVYNVN